jgi:hypothetical protein
MYNVFCLFHHLPESCFICCGGIVCGNEWVHKGMLFSKEGKHEVALELHMPTHKSTDLLHADEESTEKNLKLCVHAHTGTDSDGNTESPTEENPKKDESTLYAFVDRKQIRHTVTEIPSSVHFVVLFVYLCQKIVVFVLQLLS